MSINIEKTLQAYEILADKMGDELEYLTKHVHDHVLLSGFIDTHEKGIMKSVESIKDSHDELLVQTFIGKLRHKFPTLHMGIKLSEFNKKRAQMIASALIVQILIDDEYFIVDKRVESVTTDGHKKFHTRLYLKLGGSHEKNLLKGIETKPGVVHQKEVNGWKLKAVEKAFLRRVATIPFCVSEVCDVDLLEKGYSLKVDWNKTKDKNGRAMPEDPIIRKRRYSMYANTIMDEVATLDAYYMPVKYCGRDRVYYEAARLDGIRPHGKLWETLMIDSAVPFDLTEDDEEILKHIIYVTLHGRVSIEKANELFSLEDLLDAQSADPMEQETEEAFGEAILLNKCYQAITDYQAGNLSKFMFGYDFTNSGLLMSGVSFRSRKMMAAGNIAGAEDVVDSHTAFGAGFDVDLERKDIKNIHMGLMHGSTTESIAKVIADVVGVDTTEEQVTAFSVESYGAEVTNITLIADWGSKIVGNKQCDLRWTMPDGFSAASRAYYKGVPVLVYAASAGHKEGYTSYVIVSDMPWIEDNKGFPMYGKETRVGGVTYKVEQKKRGLFAGMTHSIDAYMLRNVANAVMDTGRPILLKHDDFIVPPSAVHTVIEAAKLVFANMFMVNLYQEAVNEIAAMSPYNLDPIELLLGDAECTVWGSQNFLMP